MWNPKDNDALDDLIEVYGVDGVLCALAERIGHYAHRIAELATQLESNLRDKPTIPGSTF